MNLLTIDLAKLLRAVQRESLTLKILEEPLLYLNNGHLTYMYHELLLEAILYCIILLLHHCCCYSAVLSNILMKFEIDV